MGLPGSISQPGPSSVDLHNTSNVQSIPGSFILGMSTMSNIRAYREICKQAGMLTKFHWLAANVPHANACTTVSIEADGQLIDFGPF